MKTLKFYPRILAAALVAILMGCSTTSTKSADVSSDIRTSLDKSGFKDVSVSQDRDKGVVTLGGHVAAENDKSQAESLARTVAGSQVVSNQIAVIPPGVESEAKSVNSELDKAIEHNLDAALTRGRLHDNVKYAVKNHVVTLTGEVESPARSARAAKLASAVPSVRQVVNELEIKGQKATESR